MQEAKSFKIPKRLILEGYEKVKSNQGAAGVDQVTIADFDKSLKSNLYKLWNRMSSGSYHPMSVRLVEIPKSGGGTRHLGIPSVIDRIAQMSAVLVLQPKLDPIFHEDSYGYRPHRSAHQALERARKRCWQLDWVLDLEVSKFFDTIDHDLLMKAVKRHTSERWILLYIERWLKVPYEDKSGIRIVRTQGVPQGSVIGPILANLYMHYAFDEWMKRNYSYIVFERYADDVICHCRSKDEAEILQASIVKRLAECNLTLNESKTKLVYCKDDLRRGAWVNEQFDFLGFTFRARRSKNKFKVKIGRGNRWMSFKEGMQRDIEVTKQIAQVFPDCDILVDGNNGFSVGEFTQYLKGISGVNLFWIEEPFHETVAEYTYLREWLNKEGGEDFA